MSGEIKGRCVETAPTHPTGDIIMQTDNQERIRITHDGKFICMGETLEDAEGVYAAFVKWFCGVGND